MVRLSDILESLRDIQTRTLKDPTHLIVSESTLGDLINEYNEMANSEADTVYQFGERSYTQEDVEGFFGLTIAVSKNAKDDFKILEEITSDY